MKLVKFEDVYGKEVYINPERVNSVKEFADGKTTINIGEGNDTVTVKLDAPTVAHMLLSASKF